MSYATPSDLLDRKSAQTIGELVSDSGTAVTPTGLLTDSKVQAALDSASGEIDAALMQAGRYTSADLLGLTGNSLAHLKRICCDIAMTLLFARKPLYSPEDYKGGIEITEAYLEALRQGKNVFGVPANIEAGKPSVSYPSVSSIQNLHLVVDDTPNFYPIRRQSIGG